MTTFLLVEDDPTQAEAASRRINKKLGFEFEIASCGGQGIEKLKQNSYAFALFDLGLPDMDGRDILIKYYEEFNELPSFPIFALTAQVMTEEDIKTLTIIGFKGYLKKPLKMDELRKLLADQGKI